jgi:ABC-type sugar transport system ATPase subunit
LQQFQNVNASLASLTLSNLYVKLRVQMRTEIKELHQRLKTTTVYVTRTLT